MKILSTSIKSSFTIKKSKFLCFGYYVQTKEEVKDIVAKLKKEYPDASHICYAYILNNDTFYYTDGGEPSGTAGKPIYGALQSMQLNYTLFVVIRYFGGIKFGPGPLRATFKDVTLQTLSDVELKPFTVQDIITINVPYGRMTEITSIFRSSIYTQTYSHEFVEIILTGNKAELVKKLSSLGIDIVSIKENQVV